MNSFKSRALIALLSWFGRVTTRTRLRIGAALSWLVLHIAKSRVRIVRINLKLCFPDLSEPQRETLLREHIRALTQSIVDRGVLWYATETSIDRMITMTGYDEHLLPLIESGKPILMLAPHFVGLDAAATALSRRLEHAATMYTPQSNPDVDAIVRTGRGRFHDIHMVSRKEGIRALIRHLRLPRPIYYLPDMDFGRDGAIFVPFFGIPSATVPATAQIAGKFGAAVVPITEFWNPDTGHYSVRVHPPLENFPGDDGIEAATARLNSELETWVRECPSQYYWVHRRFKTRPLGEKKFY
jgi:KDO2-lipid IV(A) lauroyltransferase